MTDRTQKQIRQVSQACVSVNTALNGCFWGCNCCGFVRLQPGDGGPVAPKDQWEVILRLQPQYNSWYDKHFQEMGDKDWQKHVVWASLRGLM